MLSSLKTFISRTTDNPRSKGCPMTNSVPTRTAHCEKHGEYQQTYIPGFKEGDTIGTSRCPECVKEARAEEDKRKAAQNEYDRQHRIKYCVNLLKGDTPPRFEGATFDNYQPVCKEASAALKSCESYAKSFEKLGANGAGLIFCGMLGTGKTHLALSIGKELAKRGVEVRYANLLDLIRAVRSTWGEGNSQSEYEFLNQLARHGLLIIDEVGVQNGTENEKTILFDIINSRYENMLPTILISNLTESQIADLISARSVDRIKEGGGGTVVFSWHSYRERKTA